jgi:heme oxygenase
MVSGFAKMISTHYQVWSAVADWWPEEVSAEPQARSFLRHMVAQLRLDLEVGGIDMPPALSLQLATESAAAAARYGALYVLRGSTLGGTMINRKLEDCTALNGLSSFHFHAACAALPGKEWPAFLRELNASVQTEQEQAQAVAGAKAVFGLYLI